MVEKQTIKDKVLQTAKGDPFLSVEEIAAHVGTTARYVRTILSEARVSLTQLRKTYARTMERKLANEGKQYAQTFQPQLRLQPVRDKHIARILQRPADDKLIQVSQVQKVHGVIAFVQLFTHRELKLQSQPQCLRQLLLGASQEPLAVQAREHKVEVAPPEAALCSLLGSDQQEPLLRLSIILYNDEEPVALEVQWLPSSGVSLKGHGGDFVISVEASG